MTINLVIPAAGLGSRFRTRGIETPKPLIEIKGIPMIAWVIGNFDLQNDDKIFIISRKDDGLPEKIGKYLDKFRKNIEFIEILQLTDGAASTIEFALRKIDSSNPVLSANSDQFVSADFSPFMKLVRSGDSAGQILLMRAEGNKWSYVKRNLEGQIVSVVEKKQISDEATVGIYGWRDARIALDSITTMKNHQHTINGEYYVAPSYNYLDKEFNKISTYNIGNVETEVHGLGTPEDLEIFLANPNIENFRLSVTKNLDL